MANTRDSPFVGSSSSDKLSVLMMHSVELREREREGRGSQNVTQAVWGNYFDIRCCVMHTIYGTITILQ